jgi:hypothetical protein
MHGLLAPPDYPGRPPKITKHQHQDDGPADRQSDGAEVEAHDGAEAEVLGDEAADQRATDAQQRRGDQAAFLLAGHHHFGEHADHEAKHDPDEYVHGLIISTATPPRHIGMLETDGPR